MLAGMMLEGLSKLKKFFKKLSFFPLNSQKYLLEKGLHGKEFFFMDLQELARPS